MNEDTVTIPARMSAVEVIKLADSAMGSITDYDVINGINNAPDNVLDKMVETLMDAKHVISHWLDEQGDTVTIPTDLFERLVELYNSEMKWVGMMCKETSDRICKARDALSDFNPDDYRKDGE
jgi:hypothetical protein